MAIATDERDILDVYLILNLSSIANNTLFVSVPPGFQEFIDTVTVDNVRMLAFPSDVRDLLVNYILTRQLSNRFSRNIGSRFSRQSRPNFPRRPTIPV